MPASSLFPDIERPTIGDERALQLALELSLLNMNDPLNVVPEADPNTPDLTAFVNPLTTVGVAGLDEVRSKKSQNMTECVPVPSSEHVAEIVGRQGCKIKALRAKTNTYIKTPVRGEEPVFVVTGRKEDVGKAKKEILSAADHFSQIRASRKNNLAGLSGGGTPPGPPANIPGHITIQVRVPYRVVGLVVGPKGATIKRIQHQTHTYIVTPSRDKEPVFEVTGLPDSVESARREIEAHIALRTGNGSSINGLPSLSLDDDIFATFYRGGLNGINSLINLSDDSFHTTMNGVGTTTNNTNTFSISSGTGSCSSSSSTSGGRADLGNIWGSSDRDEVLGDSPSFDSTSALSSIWSYPGVQSAPTRPSPTNSTSPTDSILSGKLCAVCEDSKVTHALVPCGHNYFCQECAVKLCNGEDPACPMCSMPAMQSIRIYSPNP